MDWLYRLFHNYTESKIQVITIGNKQRQPVAEK